MSWCAVDVASPPEQRDAVAAWLVGHTGQAVQEREDGVLISVAADEAKAGALLQALTSAFGRQVAGSTRAVPEVDWRLRWRDGLGPRKVGRGVEPKLGKGSPLSRVEKRLSLGVCDCR